MNFDFSNFKFKIEKINLKLFEFKNHKFTFLPHLSKKNIQGLIIVSVVVVLISSLSGWLKLNEKDLWKIYNLLVNHFNLKQDLPDLRENEIKLEAEIEVEVDQAIRHYEQLTGDDGTVRLPPPRYSEKPVDTSVCYTDECRSLGGEMRLCAPWVLDCPPESVVK